MGSTMKEVVSDAIGGPGYREWLGEKFEPEAAKVLQARFDKLISEVEADVLRRILEQP